MSFYKNFSDHDRVVSTNPLPEEVQFLNVSEKLGDTWHSASNSPFNFTQYAMGGLNFTTSEHMFDLTFGSLISSNYIQTNIYNQFGKILLGHEYDGSIKKFTLLEDFRGNFDETLSSSLPAAFIFNISRSQTKDRIKNGTFDLEVIVSGTYENGKTIHLMDSGSYIHEGAGGHHYGILQASSSDPGVLASGDQKSSVGYIFYEAGIAVISPFIFMENSGSYDLMNNLSQNVCGLLESDICQYANSLEQKLNGTSGEIINMNEFFANKIKNVEFISITELNSTIYFCRAYNHEFNYSSNPSYIKDGEIIVKNGDPEEPSRAYITTVGLLHRS